MAALCSRRRRVVQRGPTACDSDLNPLRGQPDLQALLAQLLDRAFPADPFAATPRIAGNYVEGGQDTSVLKADRPSVMPGRSLALLTSPRHLPFFARIA